MKIIQFYQSFLDDLHIRDLETDGRLTYVSGNTQIPVTVGDRRLCLPTDAILRQGDFSALFPFHPLSENVTYGESEIIQATRDYVEHRLNLSFMTLLAELAEVAADTDRQKKLGGKASAFLKRAPKADEKFYKLVSEQLVSARGKSKSRKVVNVYLMRGGPKDSPANRTAIVSWPLLDAVNDAIEAGDTKLWGVEIRKTVDLPCLKGLLEYIIGDDPEIYSYGTRSMEAPYFHALATSFYKLASRINQLVDIHAKHMDAPDALRSTLEWAPGLDNLALYRGVIPALEGNIGAPPKGVDVPEEAARTFARPAPARAQEPLGRDMPARRGGGGALDGFFKEIEEVSRGEPTPSSMWGGRGRQQERPRSNWDYDRHAGRDDRGRAPGRAPSRGWGGGRGPVI